MCSHVTYVFPVGHQRNLNRWHRHSANLASTTRRQEACLRHGPFKDESGRHSQHSGLAAWPSKWDREVKRGVNDLRPTNSKRWPPGAISVKNVFLIWPRRNNRLCWLVGFVCFFFFNQVFLVILKTPLLWPTCQKTKKSPELLGMVSARLQPYWDTDCVQFHACVPVTSTTTQRSPINRETLIT